jgi:Domain of Unknown Function (DUF326)
MPTTTHDLEQCIENCTRCHRICLETTAIHFRGEGGGSERESLIRLLLDCAEICQTSANFMIRGSELHGHTCAACAAVCERCAEECDKVGEDPHMAACAEICRACAQTCREMAAAIH